MRAAITLRRCVALPRLASPLATNHRVCAVCSGALRGMCGARHLDTASPTSLHAARLNRGKHGMDVRTNRDAWGRGQLHRGLPAAADLRVDAHSRFRSSGNRLNVVDGHARHAEHFHVNSATNHGRHVVEPEVIHEVDIRRTASRDIVSTGRKLLGLIPRSGSIRRGKRVIANRNVSDSGRGDGGNVKQAEPPTRAGGEIIHGLNPRDTRRTPRRTDIALIACAVLPAPCVP